MPEDQNKTHHAFERHLAKSWPPDDWKDVTVLAAVSGGGDSVALLRGLAAIKMPGEGRLIAAHVNHKLRGAESDADQSFVEELCRTLSLPCEVTTVAVDVAAGGQGQGVEAVARRARYAALKAMAGRLGARFVVTAHTADDQAETILHRILRGTGIRGLAGIPRARRLGPATLLRPLLGVRRAELAVYLRDLGQPFRTDASNHDRRFTRNRIRGELLPLLADRYNSSIALALLRLGETAGESQSLINDVVEAVAVRCIRQMRPGEACLDIADLSTRPPHLVCEVLRLVWRRQGWPLVDMGFDQWNALAEMISAAAPLPPSESRKSVFPGAILADVRGSRLRLIKME
jgi:tRNA(Ile)-lysidine synthase